MPGMGSDFTSWMRVLLDTYAVQCLSVCAGKGSMLDSLPPHLIFKLLTISSHGSNPTSVPQGPLSGASNLLKCTLCVHSLYRSSQARKEMSWKVLDTVLLDCLHYESVKILWSHFMESKILLLGIRSLNDDVLSISNFSLCYKSIKIDGFLFDKLIYFENRLQCSVWSFTENRLSKLWTEPENNCECTYIFILWKMFIYRVSVWFAQKYHQWFQKNKCFYYLLVWNLHNKLMIKTQNV